MAKRGVLQKLLLLELNKLAHLGERLDVVRERIVATDLCIRRERILAPAAAPDPPARARPDARLGYLLATRNLLRRIEQGIVVALDRQGA